MTVETEIKDAVRQQYGAVATNVAQGTLADCCTAGNCCSPAGAPASWNPITADLYDAAQTGGLPEKAVLASLGCGNPTALAELKPGETVLDLGSGGGIDVLLSARRVGPGGHAFGLDMTEPMLALAEDNKRKSGLSNVHFLKGEIEDIPLPDNSVDVVISNCVINLAADKDRVLREAFRVLKPGGRFAVSDVVVRGDVPPAVQRSMALWVGCVAGALGDRAYVDKLEAAGFTQASVEVTRVYRAEDARDMLAGEAGDFDAVAAQVDGLFASAFVRAVKPAAGTAATTRAEPTTTPAVTSPEATTEGCGCKPGCCS